MTDWLNKYQQGGQIDKITKQLVSLIGKAYKEVQQGTPGEATQKLAQIMQDPQGGQLLSNLAQQMPEVGEALNVITKALEEMNNAAQGLESGGIVQQKSGGDCGCYKKLMRIGGKICQITVDCNDNIVSE